MKKRIISVLISVAMVITSFAGLTGIAAQPVMAADNPVIVDNDGETKVNDKKYDQYFDEGAEKGVDDLLNNGRCFINGIALPGAVPADSSYEYQINQVASLWKTDKGWNYNVHKYTGAGNDTFEVARKNLFEMTSTIRGHETQFYLDENGKCNAINIQSFEVMRVSDIEDMGHDTVMHRGDFELETKRVRKDVDLIHFPTENVAKDIKIGDIAVFWYGNDKPGTGAVDQWHAVRATPIVGKVTSPDHGTYAVGDWSSVESNVSRYNLIDCSRPTQGYSVYTRLEITDNEIVLWNTPNGFPIGFTFGVDKAASKENLKDGIANAEKLLGSVKASKDGTDIPEGEKWATQEAIDTFKKAIDDAKAVMNKNSSAQIDLDWAMWELRTAWGEGGEKPSGFVGEIGEGTGAAAPTDALFPDVTEDKVAKTAYAAINWAAGEGIIKGFADGTFQPEGTCTREQFVVMIWRYAGKPAATADVSFSDITADRNTYKAIQWAVEQGIIKGFDDGTFQPEGTTTRRQVAVMLWRMAGKPAATKAADFSDVQASESTYKAIQWGAEAGLIKGYTDGTFKPEADCQRQHIAIFLYRYDQMD